MSVVSKEKLVRKLGKREYRNAYAEESVKTSLPFQIRAIREQRNWSQEILGDKAGMKQNAVSRLESEEYGNLNVSTLLRLANAFDCGLLVKFVPFSKLLLEFEDVSPYALTVKTFPEDSGFEIGVTDSKSEENLTGRGGFAYTTNTALHVVPPTSDGTRTLPFQLKPQLELVPTDTTPELAHDDKSASLTADIGYESEVESTVERFYIANVG